MDDNVKKTLEKQLQLLSERSQGDEIMPDELYQLSQAMVMVGQLLDKPYWPYSSGTLTC